jgi:hypothetical protein
MVQCYCDTDAFCVNNTCTARSVCRVIFHQLVPNEVVSPPIYMCDKGTGSYGGFDYPISCQNTVDVNYVRNAHTNAYLCCKAEDMCNLNNMTAPEGFRGRELPPANKPAERSTDSLLHTLTTSPQWLAVTVIPLALLLLLLILFALLRLQHRRMQRRAHNLSLGLKEPALSPGYTTCNCPLDCSHDPLLSSSRLPDGSMAGSHAPGCYLARRTIANDVQKLCAIGTGRYGQVYRGVFMGSDVAIKIFPGKEEASWENEVNVYKQLRHKSILHYYAADRFDDSIMTELWLVVDYHKHGSLFEFLRQDPGLQTEAVALNMMHSIADGLAYLHQLIRGHPSQVDVKQEMAHCDIKSRNILVKDDLTCCIADFGLAVTNPSLNEQHQNIKPTQLVGTRRYNPPDVIARLRARELGQEVKPVIFETCKQADVYCMALVFWEISRRVVPWGLCDNELPLFEHFPDTEPTVEEMFQVCCEQGQRPRFSNTRCISPESAATKKELEKLTAECMNLTAPARLPALLMKKRISRLLLNHTPVPCTFPVMESMA